MKPVFQFVNQLEMMTDCFRKDFGAPTARKSACKTQNEGLVQAYEKCSALADKGGGMQMMGPRVRDGKTDV